MKLLSSFLIVIASCQSSVQVQGFVPIHNSGSASAVSSDKILKFTAPSHYTCSTINSSSTTTAIAPTTAGVTNANVASTSTRLFYGNDPPKDSKSEQKLKSGFWNALSHTEEWMSNTLKAAKTDNPLMRNEVSYECEMNQGILSCITGIFR